MDADASRLDDPELSDGRFVPDSYSYLSNEIFHSSKGGPRVPQDDDASVSLRWVVQDL